MALSGSISTATWYGSNTSCSVIFNWTATQNIENNTSTISWNLKSSVSYGYVTISELRLKFGDEQIFYRSTSVSNDAYNGTTLASGTKTITHNTDGTKSFNVSVEAGIYEWAINKKGSGTITLDTIPRSSSIISASNVALGNACNVKWKPNSSSFKYKITFSLGSWSYTTNFINPSTTGEYTYTGYIIPNNETLLKQMPNSTTGTMYAVLITYNSSGTQIGSASAAKTFTVTAPSTTVPYVGTITLSPVGINGQNILVQGKNKITVSVSGCSASAGSSIKSYTFSGPGISYTGTSTSVTSSSTISNAGTLTYTVTVTDNRGRSASKTAQIICHTYSAPYFKSFNVYRVGSSTGTTVDNSGTFARCIFDVEYSDVNGTNDVTVDIHYKGTGDIYSSINAISDSKDTSGYATISDIDISSTYAIYATISDNYGGSSTSTITTIFSESRIFNITSDGTGFAIGKMAESNNLFECRWPAKFDDGIILNEPLSIKNGGTGADTAQQALINLGAAPVGLNTDDVQFITSNDELNSAITTAYNSMDDYSVKFKIVHVNASGLSLDSGSWQFIINRADANYGTIYGSCYNYNGFVYRILHDGTWGDWQGYTPTAFAPAGYGLGTVYPSVIYSPEELDACRTCGFYCCVYAGTICGIYFDYANLTVYSIWGNECVQELRPLNTNYCFRRFYFEGAWSAWEQAGMMTQILWVNASPTSNFAAQTIHMNLSNYKAVYVQSVRSTDDQTISGGTLAWVDIGSNYLTGTTDQYAATRRKVTATSSGVTFSGFSSANTSNGASNEIPWVICGIRGINW